MDRRVVITTSGCHAMLCSCGRDLQFMGYHLRRGIHYPMIEVGCPQCNTHFYYAARDKEEVKNFPHMSQMDSIRLTKIGFRLTKDPEEVDNTTLALIDQGMFESASGQLVDRGSFAKYVEG